MSEKDKRYRFAFDLGTNSIGWAVFELSAGLAPVSLTDAGVRMFSDSRDPKSGASLAEVRRAARTTRRNRDRYLQRRTFLMAELIKAGLMPAVDADRKALERLDPYDLRRKGLYEALNLHEFGRVLFHLNQRRGFQSNRIADSDTDGEDGKIKKAAAALNILMAANDCKTYGEFLAKRHDQRENVRIRLRGKNAKTQYDFYPTRDMLKAEFNKLWTEQTKHHPNLTPEWHSRLHEILFFQRPLKPPLVGKCTFFPTEERLAKAHPLSQARRIYQHLNHLRLIVHGQPPVRLSKGDRDKLASVLLSGEDVTFKTGMHKHLGLPAGTTSTLEESGKTDRLAGDQVAARLANPRKGPLRQTWGNLTTEERADIVLRLNSVQSEEALIAYLMATYGLAEDTARATANIRLPEGHDNLGLTATTHILEALKANVITYDKAVKAAFPDKHHSHERESEVFDQLPYYGEVLQRHTLGGTLNPADKPDKKYGRLSNPTVHVALNQLRRVVNGLVKEYGHPEQIVLELARDLKLSQKQKDELAKSQKDNEKNNARRKAEIEALERVATPNTLMLMRLWEELGSPIQRSCVYTGRPISLEQLLSGEVEIEHILPYSRTLDGTFANRTLAMRGANRSKRNMAPSEAYQGMDYEAIRERARALPPNKRWRFEPEAMQRFEGEDRDFLTRQLNETRHLATLVRKYVIGICNDPNAVWVVTGQLTALLRARFGLNTILDNHPQNRADHRHHAVSACVVGIIDRAFLQRVSRVAGRHEHKDDLTYITRNVPEPFEHFRDHVKAQIKAIIVSHKPEHGLGGALHKDTNYGIVTGADRVYGDVVRRKAIDALTWNEIEKVRDLKLRDQLQQIKHDVGQDAKALQTALSDFGDRTGIRRVRIFKKHEDLIRINNQKSGEAYRAVIPGSIHHVDIVEDNKGQWHGHFVNMYEANQRDWTPAWKNVKESYKFVGKLFKGDIAEIEGKSGFKEIVKVYRINPSNNTIFFAPHNEGGKLDDRHRDAEDKFEWLITSISVLKCRMFRKILVNDLGKIHNL
ncbi:MAG: HNH endonuclease domain-containing protein [Asticcacaulis sp.]|uniref:type II CRISPR RNA-guided endonuclease Cas9 n=1 Tax=Asticcacaulis sp. TaxID=1872648 RepID=UPI0039E4C9EF